MKHILTITLNPAVDQFIVVDKLIAGSMNRARSTAPMTGGKGINVARVLKRFGLPVMTTGFSAGGGGAMMAQTLLREEIPSNFISVEGEVRTNLKIQDASSGKTTEINQPGFSVDQEDAKRLYEEVGKCLRFCEALVLTGSLPAGMPVDAYRTLAILARQEGVPVFLDAEGDNLIAGLSASPFAVKPNRDELELFSRTRLETPVEVAVATRALLNYGPHFAAATMGPEGVVVADGNTIWHAPGLAITPACATGAGDATLAAMIWAWHQQLPAHQMAAAMTAAGGVTTAKPGIAFCSLREMKEAMEQVRVSPIHLPED